MSNERKVNPAMLKLFRERAMSERIRDAAQQWADEHYSVFGSTTAKYNQIAAQAFRAGQQSAYPKRGLDPAETRNVGDASFEPLPLQPRGPELRVGMPIGKPQTFEPSED